MAQIDSAHIRPLTVDETGNAPTKLILVSPVGEIGGAEQVLLTLARHLPAHNIQPILACMRPGRLVTVAKRQGTPTFVFARHRYREAIMLRKAIDWLESVARDVGTQLMHANHSGHLYSSIVARRLGVPSIWHVHDYPYNWDWIDILCRRVHSDHIIFTTNKVRSGYRGLSGRPNDVIRPIAVEPGRLKRVIPEPDIRARLKLGVGPILLTVARFQAHKGHADLLEAVPEIIRQRPDAQFVIVGQPGNDAEERYRRELLKQSEKLRLAEHVRFVGFVSENELVSLYREAFALVHPARTEGFGLAILEALAFSMPIVAAAADGPSALIDHGVTGLLVPPRSPRNLTTAVLSLLNDPQLAARLGKAGLQASSSYRSEVMVDETVAVYRSLLGGRCVTPDLSASPEANPV